MTDELNQQTTETESTTATTPVQKPAKPEPKFSQQDMDAIQANTRKEAEDRTRKAILKDLGIENVDDPDAVKTVKGKLTAAQQAEDEKKTELERVQERVAAAEQRATDAEAKALQLEAARIAERVDSKLEALARDAKVTTPEDVTLYLRTNHKDAVEALAGEDGKIDDKAAGKLLEEVKKARPHWFAVMGKGSPSNRDGRPPQPNANVVLGGRKNSL